MNAKDIIVGETYAARYHPNPRAEPTQRITVAAIYNKNQMIDLYYDDARRTFVLPCGEVERLNVHLGHRHRSRSLMVVGTNAKGTLVAFPTDHVIRTAVEQDRIDKDNAALREKHRLAVKALDARRNSVVERIRAITGSETVAYHDRIYLTLDEAEAILAQVPTT